MQLNESGGGACGCEHIRENFEVTFSETARGTKVAMNGAMTAGFISTDPVRFGARGVRAGAGCADWQHETFKSLQQHFSFCNEDARTEICDANGNAVSNRKAVNQRAIICFNGRPFNPPVNRSWKT